MNRSTFRKLPPTTEVSIIDQLSKELASAFSKDPLARAILGEWPSCTSNLAREFFRLHLLSGLEDGNVFVVGETSSVEGVAVVFGVGKDMNMESPEWQAFLNNLPSKNQEWYTSFNLQYRDFVGRAYGCDHQLKSLYLLLLGVRPSSQEKGLGTELFRGVQARAEDLDVDLCWQTTTAPEFYRKLGFKAISDTIYGNEQGNVRQWAYLDKKII
ncbi:hypothetical protein B0H10DRAFT_2036808 [Mycena sp. CBHHK59/15]|nr:hypothetical protein B0H10DRAFT_2138877 [Mycena sp. CBHHK59/15]KAJ6591927.1 hypothetical protein B0H10DRAFT_2090598 [Mycena sp. CBHHK59/15]KAJ6616594.1 hypothetical protein B0H10DRAFT_2036808 [Mycena sp. CBHHK59/15]